MAEPQVCRASFQIGCWGHYSNASRLRTCVSIWTVESRWCRKYVSPGGHRGHIARPWVHIKQRLACNLLGRSRPRAVTVAQRVVSAPHAGLGAMHTTSTHTHPPTHPHTHMSMAEAARSGGRAELGGPGDRSVIGGDGGWAGLLEIALSGSRHGGEV